jgi:hypothetical protein
LTEKDALLIGLEFAMFSECRQLSIGFGGTFKNRMINCPVKLTFGADGQKYTLSYDSGFRIMTIPSHLSSQERETIMRSTPSVLGMDVLRYFRMYLDKDKVELTI